MSYYYYFYYWKHNDSETWHPANNVCDKYPPLYFAEIKEKYKNETWILANFWSIDVDMYISLKNTF